MSMFHIVDGDLLQPCQGIGDRCVTCEACAAVDVTALARGLDTCPCCLRLEGRASGQDGDRPAKRCAVCPGLRAPRDVAPREVVFDSLTQASAHITSPLFTEARGHQLIAGQGLHLARTCTGAACQSPPGFAVFLI